MTRIPLLLLAIPLAACQPPSTFPAPVTAGAAVADATLPPPVTYANRTVLDETVGIRATRTYSALSRAGAALARRDIIDRTRFKAADARGYAAVQAIRAAYLTGNAASYSAALAKAEQASTLIAEMIP